MGKTQTICSKGTVLSSGLLKLPVGKGQVFVGLFSFPTCCDLIYLQNRKKNTLLENEFKNPKAYKIQAQIFLLVDSADIKLLLNCYNLCKHSPLLYLNISSWSKHFRNQLQPMDHSFNTHTYFLCLKMFTCVLQHLSESLCAPRAKVSYIICRTQCKMKMQGPLLKKKAKKTGKK